MCAREVLLYPSRAAGAAFAERAGSLEEIRALDFAGVRRLGVTAGASTPEDFFRCAVAALNGQRKGSRV